MRGLCDSIPTWASVLVIACQAAEERNLRLTYVSINGHQIGAPARILDSVFHAVQIQHLLQIWRQRVFMLLAEEDFAFFQVCCILWSGFVSSVEIDMVSSISWFLARQTSCCRKRYWRRGHRSHGWKARKNRPCTSGWGPHVVLPTRINWQRAATLSCQPWHTSVCIVFKACGAKSYVPSCNLSVAVAAVNFPWGASAKLRAASQSLITLALRSAWCILGVREKRNQPTRLLNFLWWSFEKHQQTNSWNWHGVWLTFSAVWFQTCWGFAKPLCVMLACLILSRKLISKAFFPISLASDCFLPNFLRPVLALIETWCWSHKKCTEITLLM